MRNKFIFLSDNSNRSLLAFGVEAVLECTENKCLNSLTDFLQKYKNDYRFGFLSYDLKNEIFNLKTQHEDFIAFPQLAFFVPKYVVQFDKNHQQTYLKGEKNTESETFISDFLEQQEVVPKNNIQLLPRLSKDEYISKVKQLQDQIAEGNIEEINFCQDFFAKEAISDILPTFFRLNNLAKAPFSCYVSWNNKHLLSASPERFIQLMGNKLISQPIKGTAKRGKTAEEDEILKSNLLNEEKERLENIMTAKMVQEEFTHLVKENTATIEELCQVYTFETVHQLISTVSGIIDEETDFASILKILFPMGSMTGLPKTNSLELIDKCEDFKRGLYSGSVGYFEPNGNFDFNVIIRSVLYNAETHHISCPVGGAITARAIPEKEYQECQIKVEVMQKALKNE